jgi:hypothetical protein
LIHPGIHVIYGSSTDEQRSSEFPHHRFHHRQNHEPLTEMCTNTSDHWELIDVTILLLLDTHFCVVGHVNLLSDFDRFCQIEDLLHCFTTSLKLFIFMLFPFSWAYKVIFMLIAQPRITSSFSCPIDLNRFQTPSATTGKCQVGSVRPWRCRLSALHVLPSLMSHCTLFPPFT